MTDTEVTESIVGWAASVTGLTAIKGHQSGDRPETPYLMVNFTTSREVRDHEAVVTFAEPATELVATIEIETEWQISLHCYGENSSGPLRKVRSHYRLPRSQDSINPLVIHEIGPINRVPEMIENKWEDRSQCNLFVRGMACESVETEGIEKIPVTLSN